MSVLGFLGVRLGQGVRTAPFPPEANELPERFRGRAVFDAAQCPDGCRECVARLPTRVIAAGPDGRVRVDAGASLYAPDEADACPALSFTRDYRLGSATRDGLVSDAGEIELTRALDAASRRLFGRALRLRSVAAGSCGGCEAELTALSNVVFDLARFGVQFVASPRHADAIVITGTINANMRQALLDTWEATPEPRLAIAVGACAIDGGPFRGGPEVRGLPAGFKVDLWIPGCPPHPLTILDGLLRLLGKLEPKQEAT